jgi:hypothetical protein
MSGEQATAALEAKAAAFGPAPAPLVPSNAREAGARLAQLINDPEWGRKLMNGDIAVRNEFHRLSELKASASIGDAMEVDEGFETTVGPGLDGPTLSRRDMISVAEDMRAQGFNEQAIYHILNEGKFTEESVASAQYWLPRMERDPNLLCPEASQWGWPADREFQMRCFRTIAAIGTEDMP